MCQSHEYTDLSECLIEEIEHLPADSEPVQELAATMHDYISLFSAGDTGTEQGIANVWKNQNDVPEEYQMGNPDLMRSMNQALTIYRNRRGQ